jgi:peptidoglycan-N-acetylglucosamine deacetylase
VTGPAARGAALAGLAAAGLAVAHAAPGLTALGPVRRRLFPRLAGLGRPDHVALTFDDGPDPASTPAFLDLLAGRDLHATFFLLGSMVARTPRLAGDIAAAGHEIAVHGWDHRYTILRSPWDVFGDLARARDAVSGATGQRPRFFRPPYGVLSSGAVLAARRLGLTPVLWSSCGREWAPGASADSVFAAVAADLAGGATVLLHDSDCTSPAGAASAVLGALPRLLDECAARGLAVGTLADHGLDGGAADHPAGDGRKSELA